MFKNLKFNHKIFFIPSLAALTFMIIFIMTQSFTRKNAELLNRIVSGYAPAWELSRDLLETLGSIQRSLQDAVAAADEDELARTDSLRYQFLQRINSEKENPVLNAAQLNNIQNMFLEYYNLSRGVSLNMIRGQSGQKMTQSLESMREKYLTLRKKLKSDIESAKSNMARGFTVTQKNNRAMMISTSIASFVFIILISLLSLFVVRSISSSLKIAINVAEKVADGDLTVNVPSNTANDEAGILLEAFRKMVENLRGLSGQIKEGANALAASASEISASVSQIASGATETASAASETSTTVEEVRQTAIDSNQKSKSVSESAQKAVEISQIGEKSVNDTINEMHRIETQMESIAESIMKLSEHGKAIGEIIAAVEDMAEQSRLLAVNASIEAAKAGEHGKGFGVVAQEVRSLAEQSKEATAKVRRILDDIQKATSETVMKTEQGSKAVESGVKQSTETGEAIQRLASSVAEAAQATTQIAVSSQEQLVGMDQVVSAMESINQASSQNVGAIKQVESASQDLHNLGQKLQELVEQYKI